MDQRCVWSDLRVSNGSKDVLSDVIDEAGETRLFSFDLNRRRTRLERRSCIERHGRVMWTLRKYLCGRSFHEGTAGLVAPDITFLWLFLSVCACEEPWDVESHGGSVHLRGSRIGTEK